MIGFVIRSATPSDVDGFVELLDSVASEGRWIGVEGPIDRNSGRERYLEKLAESNGQTLLAESQGRIIGEIGLRNYRGLVELGMMVADEWRGKGVGSALLQAGIDWACAQDAHKLSLQVWPHNAAAIALYEKFGFVREGHLVKQWKRRNGELWDSYIMGRLIDRSTT